MITVTHTGAGTHTTLFLQSLTKKHNLDVLNKYGERGVKALSDATPKDTGKTASMWRYEIQNTEKGFALNFINDNVVDGWCNIAIILQYGHGTRYGGYVEGRDYINPAIRPIFDDIAEKLWEEVRNS